MSRVVPSGAVEADHWSGMASAVAHYIELWMAGAAAGVVFPKGQFQAGQRFFARVLEGVALNSGKRIDASIGILDAMSNFGIAAEVLAIISGSIPGTADDVQQFAQTSQRLLAAAESGADILTLPPDELRFLCQFLRAMQDKGELVAHRKFYQRAHCGSS